MTFVRVVGPEIGPPTYHISERGNATVVHSMVGYDDKTECRFSVFCGFDVMAGDGLEFYFILAEISVDGELVNEFWSGRDVARFTSRSDRDAILQVVLTATHMLVERVRPNVVYMVTHDPKLPEKALVKYSLILDAFDACGYDARATDPYQGYQSWWLSRRDEIDGPSWTSENAVQ